MSFVLAIDQGTTSSRAIVFRSDISIAATAQQEFPQHFPASGWVEHEPEDIWNSTVAVCREALEKAGLKAKDIAAIGITNQRETTVVWDRATGQAVHRAIVWQDRRTADICAKLKSEGHEPAISARTGLIIDPYFSGTKVAWILDHVPGARERAGRGELLFGTVDCYLLWRLTGGKVHASDATNASRTLLFNIHTGEWDDELLKLLRVPRSMLPEVKDFFRQIRRQRSGPVRWSNCHFRHRRRPAGRDHRPGLLHAGHDQVDLRHRLLRPAQHRHHATATSGETVTFTGTGQCTMTDGNLTVIEVGSCTVTAHQGGNNEYAPALDVTRTFKILRAPATIVLANASFTYDATGRTVPAATIPSGLTGVSVSYSRAGTAVTEPTNAGSYECHCYARERALHGTSGAWYSDDHTGDSDDYLELATADNGRHCAGIGTTERYRHWCAGHQSVEHIHLHPW